MTMFTIEDIPDKIGKGWRATQNISANSLILAEAPLVILTTRGSEEGMVAKLNMLTPDKQRAFYSLFNYYTEELGTAQGITATNSFSGEHDHETIVYEKMSRINHSCYPNARWNWDSTSRVQRLHAVRDIAQGEEITISYGFGPSMSYATRQSLIKARYGFDCKCELCVIGK